MATSHVRSDDSGSEKTSIRRDGWPDGEGPYGDLSHLQEEATNIRVDETAIETPEQAAVAKLVRASQIAEENDFSLQQTFEEVLNNA